MVKVLFGRIWGKEEKKWQTKHEMSCGDAWVQAGALPALQCCVLPRGQQRRGEGLKMGFEKCALIPKRQTKSSCRILPQEEVGYWAMRGTVREAFLCCAAEDACGVTQRAGRGCLLTCHPCNVLMCSNK